MINKETERRRKKLLSPEYYLYLSRESLKRRDYGCAWCYLELAKNVGHSGENPRTAEYTSRLEANIWGRMKAEIVEIALKYNLEITDENQAVMFKEHSPSWTRYTEVRDSFFGLVNKIREEENERR